MYVLDRRPDRDLVLVAVALNSSLYPRQLVSWLVGPDAIQTRPLRRPLPEVPLANDRPELANDRSDGARSVCRLDMFIQPSTSPPHTSVSFLHSQAQTRLMFEVPSRGLMGFGAEIRQETHGSAVVNSTFA